MNDNEVRRRIATSLEEISHYLSIICRKYNGDDKNAKITMNEVLARGLICFL